MKADQLPLLTTGKFSAILLLLSSIDVIWGFPGNGAVFHMEVDSEHHGEPLCLIPDENARFDCYPDPGGVTQQNCEARGCCWQVPSNAEEQEKEKQRLEKLNQTTISIPYCYFPANYNGYEMTDLQETTQGYHASLLRTTQSGWPSDVMKLNLDVYLETTTRLHFKIYDASQSRYEVPLATKPNPPERKANNTDYIVNFKQKPFGISVYRKSTGALLFNTAIDGAPLVFADQFLQISTLTETGLVYGLGEHKARLLHTSDWQSLVMWAHDMGPQFNSNLYGSHPFYVGLEESGDAHGVFLLNSNAMEVLVQPLPALTFRTIGGILDFYILTGPSPDSVVVQYTDIIGKPAMPPYWALGFHLCRYGYESSAQLKEVIARNRALQIPYEVQWTDIDYMDHYRDWTYDNKSFVELPEIVEDLHNYGQKHIMIIDPGISNQYPGQYPPYDEGVEDDIFVKNATGQILIGAVWPGATAYPDWTHPKVGDWWYKQAKSYHDQVPYDGIWIDMNEPSNFKFGSSFGCTNDSLDNPPYTPAVAGRNLASRTVCPSAKQYVSSHYNVHNMYGFGEAIASNYALEKLLNKRSIIISRSTFAGHGHYAGHWSGDISSTWEDLYYSIPLLLNFQMYGIPLVGADICGFSQDATEELCIRWMQLGSFYPFMRNHRDRNGALPAASKYVILNFQIYGIPLVGADTCGFGGNTTEELCIRWMQLASFYPFMRNHNSLGQEDQDPAAFSVKAQQIMKTWLEVRYMLLPHLYTLFHHSHKSGQPVARPLFFQYPQDPATYDIDQQFMWGDSLLISPALYEGQTEVTAYFPKDKWYDLTPSPTPPIDSVGQWETLSSPLDTIRIHVRGGTILPAQEAAINTVLSRTKAFGLVVALNSSGEAFGSLFWDDGESFDTHQKGEYTAIQFLAKNNKLTASVEHDGYKPETGMVLEFASILGVMTSPTDVNLNGKKVPFKYDRELQVLSLSPLKASLLSPLSVQWS